MALDVRNERLLELVDAEAVVEQLATGMPIHRGTSLARDRAVFCFLATFPQIRCAGGDADSGMTVFRDPSGKSNGLTYDKGGHLIACEHANRRVSRTTADGQVITIASHYEGKRLNSPNDVVVKSDGSIYFTDPPYGLSAAYGVESEKELDFQGGLSSISQRRHIDASR